MKIFGKDIAILVGGGLAGMVMVIAAAWLVGDRFSAWRAGPELVTADIVGIANERTLALASRDLEPEEIEAKAREWARDFQQLLEVLADDNNIIILPAGIGVYGTRDITAELRRFTETLP